MAKKEKSEAHTRMSKAIAYPYLAEVHRVLDNPDLDALGKAQALFALESNLWDLLGTD